MITTWVLLVYFAQPTFRSAPTAVMQEFHSQAACVAAGDWYIEQARKHRSTVTTFCQRNP